MPCKVKVDIQVQSDFLDCTSEARRQISAFLLELQDDPLPAKRQPMGDGAFFAQLPCGYFVSWEILGNFLTMAFTRSTKTCLLRILGIGIKAPSAHRA